KIRILALQLESVFSIEDSPWHSFPGIQGPKCFLPEDLEALKTARAAGLILVLFTRLQRSQTHHLERSLDAHFTLRTSATKLDAFERLALHFGVQMPEISFIGGACHDHRIFQRLGFTMTPANASAAALNLADTRLNTCSGDGVIAEAIPRLLSYNKEVERIKVEERAHRLLQNHSKEDKTWRRQAPQQISQAADLMRSSLEAGRKLFFYGDDDNRSLVIENVTRIISRFGFDHHPRPARHLNLRNSGEKEETLEFVEELRNQLQEQALPGDSLVIITQKRVSSEVIALLVAARKIALKTIVLLGRASHAVQRTADVTLALPQFSQERSRSFHREILRQIAQAIEGQGANAAFNSERGEIGSQVDPSEFEPTSEAPAAPNLEKRCSGIRELGSSSLLNETSTPANNNREREKASSWI
ncbi:MAG: SIS domain-containing protein, partial [Polyangiaceae bacterium]|nr:SIS domain-containing protein [Polyangiaceae bacterium]